MRWEDERQSDSVDDVRGESGGGGGGFGGGGGIGLLGLLPLLLRGGPVGIIVLIIIGAVMFGGPLLRGGGGSAPTRPPSGYQGDVAGQQAAQGAAADPQAQDLRFVKAVTAYTEDTWGQVFQEMGRTYQRPRVEIYSRSYPTACGQGSAEMGPFYCPGDRKVYLDLAFFNELSSRFGAPGRFAQAYVIAHEVGHHVQNLLGTMDQNRTAGGSRNQTSVRTELQADCYAGVWANRTNARTHFLDPGDIDEGLKAASAVGDDTLQKETQGRVVPDSFTHGSAAQRTHWFKAGYESGDIKSCDTFSGGYDDL